MSDSPLGLVRMLHSNRPLVCATHLIRRTRACPFRVGPEKRRGNEQGEGHTVANVEEVDRPYTRHLGGLRWTGYHPL